ncbi:hypothetical protein V4C53_42580 [Paraburkholderia azotifigens]|uniref:hypothetical protein n=1 Tax=Paraburkholderia azotifigens TaxID=2057004 RepID=UPI00317B482B
MANLSAFASGVMAAWTGDHSVEVQIEKGDEVAAAARAACKLAASWINDDDVKTWKVATAGK